MTDQTNVQTAVRFLETYVADGPAAVRLLLADGFVWWSPRSGEIQDRLEQIRAVTRQHYKAPPVFTITGLTADGDRVAVEARSVGKLSNGRTYDNRYHFLLLFDAGKVAVVREYNDTKHVADVWSGLL